MLDVRVLVTEHGESPFGDWFHGLRPDVADRVDTAIERMRHGNLGDHKDGDKPWPD